MRHHRRGFFSQSSLFRDSDLKMRWHELTTSSHSLIWRCFLFVSGNMCFSWWDLTPPLEQHGARKSDKVGRETFSRRPQTYAPTQTESERIICEICKMAEMIKRGPSCTFRKSNFSPLLTLKLTVLYLSAQYVLSHSDLCICCTSGT